MTKRYSKKREAILALLRETRSHPDAEWIYQRAKLQYPDLSLGTVYRNLSELSEDGTIISVAVVDGRERYDANIAPHPHFICGRCAAVIDLPDEYGSVVLPSPMPFHGRIDRIENVYHGLCEDCLNG